MRKKIFMKLLATSLAVAVCFTGINFSPLLQGREVQAAKKLEEEHYQQYLQDTKVEIKAERTEDMTVYQLADGTKEAVMYAEKVRFKNEEGELVDYEPMLVDIPAEEKKHDTSLIDYAYENKTGDMKNYIPEILGQETPIRMEKEDMAISIAPVYEEKQSAFENTEELESADEIQQEYTDSYDETSMETTGVTYATEDAAMELQYYSYSSGIKEAIILNEKPDNNEFVFQLDLKGLTPVYNEKVGSVLLLGEDNEEPEAFIEAPYMVDAEDNYSEDLYYEVEENTDGTYQLRLVVSQEFLDAAKYPVEIDPTTTWRTDPLLADTYVISGSTYGDTNFCDADVTLLSVGKATQGVCRGYMKMELLLTTIKGYCVTNAKLYIYESGSNHSEGNTIQVRYPTENWSLGSVTWNNQPAYSGVIDTITTAGTINTEQVFDITSYARKLASGSIASYGLMLRNANESSGYNKFYGSRNTVTTKRPKVVVTYVDGPTIASAVSVSPTVVKPGGSYTVTWSGITTSYLSYVHYRTANSSGTNEISYSSATKIGTSGSGSSSITVPDTWADGTYKTYVRGVDIGGIAGTGKGASFIVDGTNPILSSAIIAPSTSATSYSNSLPTISWTASDANFRDVYCLVSGTNKWLKLSTSSTGSVTIPASAFPATGKYGIYLRVFDKAGNYATSSLFVYYYNASALEGLTASINHAGTNVAGNTNTPTLTWNIADAEELQTVEYSVNSGDYVSAGSDSAGTIQLDSSLFPEEGTYKINVRATDTAGKQSEVVVLEYVYDATAPQALNISSSKTDTGIRVYLRDVAADNWDTSTAYYAVVPATQGTPADTDYSQAEAISYENDTMILDIPISEATATEDVYLVYVALKDTIGNVGYINPSAKSWYNINAVYDGTLIIDATQKVGSNEAPTEQWYLTWDIGNSEENDADEIITTADVYESRDGAAFVKLGTSTNGQMLMTLPDTTDHATYRIVATYQDGSRKISDVTSLKKSEKNDYIEDVETELEMDLTEEESEELVELCAVAVETAPANDGIDAQATGDVEIETVDYIYTSEDIDSDSDGLLDGYEIWELSSCRNNTDTDGDGFDDYYEVSVLGTDPVIYTADADSDNDTVSNQIEYADGTDPYLPDTDFDGVGDSSDEEPLKTDTSSTASISYDIPMHEGLYDVRDTYGENEYAVRNIYSGIIKTEVTGSDYIRYYYDSNENNTATVTKADGQYVLDTASFDENGNMTFLTHNGLGYTFLYNDDNLTSVAVNGQTLVSYSYVTGADDAVLQSQVTYANGGAESYSYTTMDITATTENEDGTTSTETSAQSMLTGVAIDGESAFAYTYDSEGNVIKLTDTKNGVVYDYVYDDGTLVSVTGNNGFNISYQQTDESNEDSKLAKYTNISQYTVDDVSKTLTYSYENTNTDNNNYTSQSSLVSGGRINVTVTEDGDVHTENLKNASGTQIASRTTTVTEDITTLTYGDGNSLIYVYDEDGNISQIREQISTSQEAAVLQSYTYDAFGQLTEENDAENNRSATFTYDLNGNILSKVETVNGTSTTHTYQYGNSQWRDLLTSYDGDAITYDAGGNPLTYRDGITFTWQNGRQLALYEDDAYRITYDYNDSGIRVKKTVTDKVTGTVAVTENYLEGTNIVAQKITTTPRDGSASTEIIWHIYDGTGAVVGMQTNAGTFYFKKNLQGDITAIINDSGAEIVSYNYDAWGNVLSVSDTSNADLAEKNPYTYRGYYRDNETGFYYLQSRYYDAEIGRFLNADTTEVLILMHGISGKNLFSYCVNNPVSYMDYSGYVVLTVTMIVAGVAIIVLVTYWIIYCNTVSRKYWSGKHLKNWIKKRFYVATYVPLAIYNSIIALSKASKVSKKARSTNAPSWVFFEPPKKGEKAKDYAKRILDKKYGKGNWKTGPNSEYNKIVKFATRNLGLK